MEQEARFSIPCSRCEKTAATIGFGTNREVGLAFAQQGFLGDVFATLLGRRNVTAELFAEIHDLARKDLKSLHAMDPDFFGFICRECIAAYCRNCWADIYPTFDDGFFDETRGTCPRGHEQMLQD